MRRWHRWLDHTCAARSSHKSCLVLFSTFYLLYLFTEFFFCFLFFFSNSRHTQISQFSLCRFWRPNSFQLFFCSLFFPIVLLGSVRMSGGDGREKWHNSPRNESKKVVFLPRRFSCLTCCCLPVSFAFFYFIMWRGETQDGEAENERESGMKRRKNFSFFSFFSSPFFARLLSSFSNSLRFVLLLGFTHSFEMISNSSTKYLQKFVLIKRESQKKHSRQDRKRTKECEATRNLLLTVFPSVVALSSFTCPVPVACISSLYDQAEMETDARGWGHNGELFFTLSAWR